MSIHIGAQTGQVAPTVLMPGDPLRAKFIAETMLADAVCFNKVRGMYGYTGRYGEKTVSVMGSGMGMPTLSIYVNELAMEYGVKTILRVGTCGALQPDLRVGDVVLAMAASTDSHTNRLRFGGMDYAATANFGLLMKAWQTARECGIDVQVGGIFSSDSFYKDNPDWWKIWANFGLLACEMETNALYTLAAKFNLRALSILTVSDSLVTEETSSAEQREQGFPRMVEIALKTAD